MGNANNQQLPLMTPADLEVPSNLSFIDQVRRHVEILEKLRSVTTNVLEMKETAKQKNSLQDYLAAEEDERNSAKAYMPYVIANERYRFLLADGYILNDLTGRVCKPDGTCVFIEATVAVCYLFGEEDGLSEQLHRSRAQPAPQDDPERKVDVIKFIQFLSDKPLDLITFGILPAIRDAILKDDQGEIAMWIRDPGRRTVDIIINIRDGVVTGNGEIAKIIRDPIKCTIGRLWGGC